MGVDSNPGFDPSICLVRTQLGYRFVGLDQPYFPVFEVVEQGMQVLAGNLTGPDDFGVIDVSGVVDPLVVNVVDRAVSNEHEMLAR
jgi:hypothetical protein